MFASTEEAVSIFKSAMKSWSDVSGIKFEYQGTTTTTQFNLTDGKVVFGWADPDEVRTHFGGDGSIGAFVWYDDAENIMNDARMTLNTARYSNWTNPYNKKYYPSVKSWKGLITHELGHVLGIAHSDISESVMFANPYHGTVYMETLRADDIDAVTTLYPKEEESEVVVAGIFDGAGSLVSPNKECWGCDRDEARMQPYGGVGSTVVFQFYKNANCSHIDIRSKYDIGEVIIRSKGWRQTDLTEKAYRYANLTIGDADKLKQGGVSIEPTSDRASNGWTTLAITTVNPISRTTPIYAFCRTDSDIFNSGGREKVDTDLVDVTYDYFWTGTGSLISLTNQSGFGSKKDWAVPFKTVNSLTSFQWETTNCKEIRITNGTTNNYTDATVDIKGWAESHDAWEQVCSQLPCTVQKSSNAYYILKIKSEVNTISEGYLQAQCVE
jgi:hypothetical protein